MNGKEIVAQRVLDYYLVKGNPIPFIKSSRRASLHFMAEGNLIDVIFDRIVDPQVKIKIAEWLLNIPLSDFTRSMRTLMEGDVQHEVELLYDLAENRMCHSFPEGYIYGSDNVAFIWPYKAIFRVITNFLYENASFSADPFKISDIARLSILDSAGYLERNGNRTIGEIVKANEEYRASLVREAVMRDASRFFNRFRNIRDVDMYSSEAETCLYLREMAGQGTPGISYVADSYASHNREVNEILNGTRRYFVPERGDEPKFLLPVEENDGIEQRAEFPMWILALIQGKMLRSSLPTGPYTRLMQGSLVSSITAFLGKYNASLEEVWEAYRV